MSTTVTPTTPQGAVPAIGVPESYDYPRLVFAAPYHTTVAIAEIIEPSVTEAVEAQLPGLVPPYVDAAAIAAVNQNAVLLAGSTMHGALYLSPTMPTQPSQAASKSYVDTMLSTAGVPEVPAVPAGQLWARQTGQWSPISEQTGVYLPLTGGTMQGQINMSGSAITNLPALPVMPNGAAPAQWVLNQIAAQNLYQGTWNADTNTPDLTQPQYHVNSYTWICVTTSTTGVVVSQPIPGLQGLTVYNGDNIIFSAIAGQFQRVAGGGLTLAEANALYVALAGSQMSGALLLNANATAAMQAVPLQQVQSLIAGGGLPEAPNDGQIYGRQGLAHTWMPVLPLGGGILTGALTLAGNASGNLGAVPLQQLTSNLANYVPLTGNVTVTGPITMGAGSTITLSANAAQPLQVVPLQQVTGMLTSYAPLNSPAFTGTPSLPSGTTGVTQPATANDTTLATTAFVEGKAAGAVGNVGRNLVHNAQMLIQQRGAGPWSTTNAYTADRWQLAFNLDTGVAVAIVAATDAMRTTVGDEAIQSFLSVATTGNAGAASFTQVLHKIENARRLGGKTIILSFWAWTNAAPAIRIGVQLAQVFGTGGSPSAPLAAPIQTVQTTTTITRYSLTFNIPSNVGATFGTNNDSYTQVQFIFSSGTTNFPAVGVQSGTGNLWGVQLEVAQPGQTQPTQLEKISIDDDLRHCQRFYQSGTLFGQVNLPTASATYSVSTMLPVYMRAPPTVAITANNNINISSPTVGSLAQFGAWASGIITTGGNQTTMSMSFSAAADL